MIRFVASGVLIGCLTILLFCYLSGIHYYFRTGYYLLTLSKIERQNFFSSVKEIEDSGGEIGIYGFKFGDRIAIWGIKGISIVRLGESWRLNCNKKDCLLKITNIKGEVVLGDMEDFKRMFANIKPYRGYLVMVSNISDNDFNNGRVFDLTIPVWWNSLSINLGSKCR